MIWPDRRICDLFGVAHPIVQAPMAGSDTPALAAAVANAGAVGSLGCAFLGVEGLKAAHDRTRAATNGALNLNFFVHAPPRPDSGRAARTAERLAPLFAEHGLGPVPEPAETPPPFGEAQLARLLDAPPRIVSFHFGLPQPEHVAALKAAGVRILSSATTPAEARDLEARGADAVIAQGWEAGGHHGYYLTERGAGIGTLALVPQVVDAVGVPVIAAGGIADGRGIAAALALGAAGVQIGTAFLTTAESGAPAAHRAALMAAEGSDTRPTRAFSGRPARGLVNRYMEAMAAHEDDLPDFPLLNAMTGPLRRAGAAADNADLLALWSGQAVGLNRTGSAAGLVARLVEETRAAIARLG